MKTMNWLRIAAGMTAVQAVAHTFGGVLGPIQPGNQLVAAMAMKANRFDVMGNSRTFWDFFIGFGLCVSVFLVMEAGLLWMAARTIDRSVTEWRPILLLLLLGNVLIAALGVVFFFPGAAVAPGVNVICLLGVLAKGFRGRQRSLAATG